MKTMRMPSARSAAERKEHVLKLLISEEDAWVATASPQAEVTQVPLSFAWNGAALILSTPITSPTGRNLATSGVVRIALGTTRDVVLIEGRVRTYTGAEIPADLADFFAETLNWDPRGAASGEYGYYEVEPVKVQSWREANELKGRTLMREGQWLV